MAERYVNVDAMRPSAASKWANRAAAAVQARYDGFSVGLGVTDYGVGPSSGTWDPTGIDAFCAAVAPTGLKASCILSPNTCNYANASWISVLGTAGVDYTSTNRIPIRGADENAAVHNGAMARFMSKWVYYGGDSDDVRWELGREINLGGVNGPQEAAILSAIKTNGEDVYGYFETYDDWTDTLASFITGDSDGIVNILEAVVPLLNFQDRTVIAPSVMGNFLNSAEATAIAGVATDVWPYWLGRPPDITVDFDVAALMAHGRALDTLRRELNALDSVTNVKGSLMATGGAPGLEWFNASNIPNLEWGFEVYLGNALSKWRTDPYSLRMIHVLVAMARMRLLRQYLTINGISSPRLHCVEWGLARGWRTGAPSAQGRCNHSEIAWGNALGGICDGMCKIPGLDSHAMYDWVARASSVDPPAGAQSSFGIISSDELTVSKAYQSLCVANGAASPTNPPYGSWYSVGTDAGVAPDLD